MKAAPLFAALAVAACVPATSTSSPAAPRVATPAPAPRPAALPQRVVPLDTSWQDAPLTSGAWFYEGAPGRSRAGFGDDRFRPPLVIACDLQRGKIGIAVAGPQAAPLTLQIMTETAQVQVVTTPEPAIGGVAALIDPRDPILDAMALSKGRFAITVEGYAPIIAPSHAEVSRVIEDCR